MEDTEKYFRKVVWFREGHKIVLLVWPWIVVWKSR